MVLHRALNNDNQAFLGGLINRTFKKNIFAFESQILILLNGYFRCIVYVDEHVCFCKIKSFDLKKYLSKLI